MQPQAGEVAWARDALLTASGAVLVSMIFYGTLRQGAFFNPELRIVEIGVLTAAGLAIAVGVARRGLLTPATWCGIAIVTWTVVRAVGSPSATPGIEQAVLVAAVVGAHAAGRLFDGDLRTLVLRGLVASGVLAALSSVGGVVLHREPYGIPLRAGWRGSSTITYANATACFLVLLLFVLAYAGRSILPAAAARAISALFLAGAAATLCRASVPAIVVGVVAARLCGRRAFDGSALPVLAGGLIGFAAIAPSIPLDSVALPWLAWSGLLLGCAVATREAPSVPELLRGPRRGTVVVLCVAAVAATVVLAARPFSDRLADVDSVSARTGSWEEYVELARDHLLTGTGPRAFGARFGLVFTATYFAHNEYLQVLAELGLVGLVLVAAAIAFVGRDLWRTPVLDEPAAGRRAAAIAAGAALAVFSATDFVWNVPVIPLMAAVILGLGVSPQPGPASSDETGSPSSSVSTSRS